MEDETNKPCTILVVEDDEGLTRLIEKSLKKAGYDVGVVPNGALAVDWVVNNSVDLMLLDYKLPDMSARQIVEALKERKIEIPFIIMTGHGDEKIAVEMMKSGAKDYIVKEGGFLEILPHVIKLNLKQLANEKKLAEAEENLVKLSHAIEQSPAIVVITDTDANIEYVNPEFTQVTGYTCEEVIGKNPRIMKSGKTSPEVYKELWSAITSGSEWKGEFCNKKKNGEHYWEHASISPVKNTEGVITNFIAVKEDITERKRMEERLLQSEKLKAMGVMAAGIAHDFNNVLAIILGYAQLLGSSCDGNEELANGLRTICRAVKDGTETVRRMSEFTRMEKGTSKHVSVDMMEIVEQAIDFSKPKWKDLAHARGVTYNLDIGGLNSVPNVLGKPSELREVITNMINNALDAMPGGGRISFRTWNKDNTVCMSISDNGSGMSKDVQMKIFDPFYSTKGVEGSGLGMSVGYGIIGKHSGNIDIESQIGKGTVFTIRLPVATETINAEAFIEPVINIKTSSYSILVVDDVREISALLNMYLSREGYNVNSVESGAEAIKLLERESFDLVLCDLGMPEVSGWDMIRAIESLDRKPKIGLITGWADMLRNEGIGVDFVVSKPIDFSILSGRIKEALMIAE
jgi:two-component system NtrC family sensor kinase